MTGFGEGTVSGWGVGESGDESALHADLGDGHSIHLNPDALERLFHLPQVAAAVRARANQLCDTANGLVNVSEDTVERLGGMPAYEVSVDDGGERPAAFVHPKYAENGASLGFVDDAANSTLYKAMLQHSDPEETL